jgi:hypothetical protein
MQITSLEIVLAVVAVFVVFGPMGLPRLKKKSEPMEVAPTVRTAYVPNPPSQHAAGRAPSPLKLRADERPLGAAYGERIPNDRPQFAVGNPEGAPLPHEMLRV